MGYSYEKATEGTHFRNFYARLKRAMSLEQALETLGFDPKSHPTEPEISKAYKIKAIENHPDRGGSHQKMVDVNVAKDVLLGKQRPDRGSPSPSGPRPTWTPEEGGGYNPSYARPDSPPKRQTVTFEDAIAKAGIPADVEWLFVTDMQHSPGNYSSDEYSNFKRAFCAVGKSKDSYVFAAAGSSQYDAYVVGGGGGHDIWEVKSDTVPAPAQITPAWLFNGVVRALGQLQVKVRFNSKVRPATGATFSPKMPNLPGSATSIKHLMVGLGMVDTDDPSVANRKQVVEIKVEEDRMYGDKGPKPGYVQGLDKHMFWDGQNHNGWFKVTLTLNSKEVVLSEKDFHTFCKLKVGGQSVKELCEGKYGAKKVITRMPKGKIILQGLIEHLTDLPDDAAGVLAKAAAQMKG
jgi:hypothetical protein